MNLRFSAAVNQNFEGNFRWQQLLPVGINEFKNIQRCDCVQVDICPIWHFVLWHYVQVDMLPLIFCLSWRNALDTVLSWDHGSMQGTASKSKMKCRIAILQHFLRKMTCSFRENHLWLSKITKESKKLLATLFGLQKSPSSTSVSYVLSSCTYDTVHTTPKFRTN